MQSFINRINELNPILNSVIDTCFDEALRQADEVDRKIQADEITAEQMLKDTPFMGVPFTTKDSLAIKGIAFNFKMFAMLQLVVVFSTG